MVEPVSRSTQLAERLAAFRLRDVPPEVVVHAKLILLDTLGAMLAGSSRRVSAPPYSPGLRPPAGRAARIQPGGPAAEDLVRQHRTLQRDAGVLLRHRAAPCGRHPPRA